MPMEKNTPRTWIVLLNKAPKGPLTADEVRTLLEQKLLRLNDLGMLVPLHPGEEKSEWKLLWQYPEFNRRKGTPQPSPSSHPERRVEKSAEEQLRERLGDLPEALQAITPEDLLPRSQKPSLSEFGTDFEAPRVRGVHPKPFSKAAWGSAGALTILLLILVTSQQFKNAQSFWKPELLNPAPKGITEEILEDPQATRTSPTAQRAEATPSAATRTKAPAIPAARPFEPAPPPEPERAPATADRGYLDERRDSRRLEEEEDSDDDYEDEIPVKKKKRKRSKRKIAVEEEEDASEALSPEDETPEDPEE